MRQSKNISKKNLKLGNLRNIQYTLTVINAVSAILVPAIRKV